MSEELSGRELTRAAYLAAGVEIKLLRDSSTKVAVWPDGTLLSYGESTEEKLWRRLPDAAASIAAAWKLLEAAVRKHRLERVSIDIGPACAVVVTLGHELDESGVFVGAAEGTTGEAAAEAICRALVAAAEKERRFTDNEVSGDDLPESGGSNLTASNGVTSKP